MEYIIIAIGVLLVILSSVIIIRQNKLIARQGNTEERRYIEQQLSAIVARQDALNGKINDDFRKIAQYLSDNSMQNEQKLEKRPIRRSKTLCKS